jgi:FAD/FMN-containing dehydrogenase
MSVAAKPAAPGLDQTLSGFKGKQIRRNDPDYDNARSIFNGMVDRKPLLIAQCSDVEDVKIALTAARKLGLPLSVRGGGHNVAGNALCDEGIVIDLSAMRNVSVDPEKRRARAQGGATWGDFDAATQAHGLATTGGAISTTGIAGLTLGGGIGWLQRKCGLTCDNLVSAEVVTADGRVLHASATENIDLFWALRGGGGNFGVVTEFEYSLHPVGPIVHGGLAIHPFSKAREVYRFYRDITPKLPDEVTANIALLTGPDGSKAIAFAVCHCGSPEQAERDLQPIRDFGPPVADHMGPMPYTAIQSMLNGGFPKGLRNYWKSDLLKSLDDGLLDGLVSAFENVPSPNSAILIEQFGGASALVPEHATAVSIRSAPYNLLILSVWQDAAQDQVNRDWARGVYEKARPFSAGRAYINYLGNETDDGAARIEAAYGTEKWVKLRAIKAKYDPQNVFRANQNITPAQA